MCMKNKTFFFLFFFFNKTWKSFNLEPPRSERIIAYQQRPFKHAFSASHVNHPNCNATHFVTQLLSIVNHYLVWELRMILCVQARVCLCVRVCLRERVTWGQGGAAKLTFINVLHIKPNKPWSSANIIMSICAKNRSWEPKKDNFFCI